MKDFVCFLNHFYLDCPPLWEQDRVWSGFQWIELNDRERNILSFKRIGIDGQELIVVCNFAPVYRQKYLLEDTYKGDYQVLLNTDDARFGGDGFLQEEMIAVNVAGGRARKPPWSADRPCCQTRYTLWREI